MTININTCRCIYDLFSIKLKQDARLITGERLKTFFFPFFVENYKWFIEGTLWGTENILVFHWCAESKIDTADKNACLLFVSSEEVVGLTKFKQIVRAFSGIWQWSILEYNFTEITNFLRKCLQPSFKIDFGTLRFVFMN